MTWKQLILDILDRVPTDQLDQEAYYAEGQNEGNRCFTVGPAVLDEDVVDELDDTMVILPAGRWRLR